MVLNNHCYVGLEFFTVLTYLMGATGVRVRARTALSKNVATSPETARQAEALLIPTVINGYPMPTKQELWEELVDRMSPAEQAAMGGATAAKAKMPPDLSLAALRDQASKNLIPVTSKRPAMRTQQALMEDIQWLTEHPVNKSKPSGRVCCCKKVKKTEDCQSNKDDNLFTASAEDRSDGWCCKVAEACKVKPFLTPATTAYSDLHADRQAEIVSASRMCLVDKVGCNSCNADEDCPGAQKCKLRPSTSDADACTGLMQRTCADVPGLSGSSAGCAIFFRDLQWVFLVTSSGGGGHISAAQAITRRVNDNMIAKVEAVKQECAQFLEGGAHTSGDVVREKNKVEEVLKSEPTLVPYQQPHCCCKTKSVREASCNKEHAVWTPKGDGSGRGYCCKQRMGSHGSNGCDMLRGYQHTGESVRAKLAKKAGTPMFEGALCSACKTAKDCPGTVRHGFVVHFNAMESDCTTFFRSVNMGETFAKQWDDAMKKEEFAKLLFFASASNILTNERMNEYGTQCLTTIKIQMRYHSELFGRKLSYVVDTQPFHKWAISEAAKDSQAKSVEMYLTDFPNQRCNAFKTTLSRLANSGGWGSTHTRLHMPEVKLQEAVQWFNLHPGQYKFEENLPVGFEYKNPNNPLPGQQIDVTWKAQVTGEAQNYVHLGGEMTENLYSFSVRAEDRVALIMLGSEPAFDTVVNMVGLMIELALFHEYHRLGVESGIAGHKFEPYLDLARSAASDRQAWLFVACGKAVNNRGPDGLYQAVVAEVSAYEEKLRALHEQRGQIGMPRRALRIVPFTGQQAILAFARANVAIVKSGGMSSAEAYQLVTQDREAAMPRQNESGARRERLANSPYRKVILINAWSSAQDIAYAVKKEHTEEAWQDLLSTKGQVPWEGGNAEYLVHHSQAKLVCVTPSVKQLLSGSGVAFSSWESTAKTLHRLRNWIKLCDGPFLKIMDELLYQNPGGDLQSEFDVQTYSGWKRLWRGLQAGHAF